MNSFIAAYNRAPALSIFGAYKNPSKRVHTAQNAYEMDWHDTAKVV